MDVIKEIASDLLGVGTSKVRIAGKEYVINPPTIERLVGAAQYISEIPDTKDLEKCIVFLDNACHAVSWFIAGDDSLYLNIRKGRQEEVVEAFVICVSKIDTRNFLKLSVSAKSVRMLIAELR